MSDLGGGWAPQRGQYVGPFESILRGRGHALGPDNAPSQDQGSEQADRSRADRSALDEDRSRGCAARHTIPPMMAAVFEAGLPADGACWPRHIDGCRLVVPTTYCEGWIVGLAPLRDGASTAAALASGPTAGRRLPGARLTDQVSCSPVAAGRKNLLNRSLVLQVPRCVACSVRRRRVEPTPVFLHIVFMSRAMHRCTSSRRAWPRWSSARLRREERCSPHAVTRRCADNLATTTRAMTRPALPHVLPAIVETAPPLYEPSLPRRFTPTRSRPTSGCRSTDQSWTDWFTVTLFRGHPLFAKELIVGLASSTFTRWESGQQFRPPRCTSRRLCR